MFTARPLHLAVLAALGMSIWGLVAYGLALGQKKAQSSIAKNSPQVNSTSRDAKTSDTISSRVPFSKGVFAYGDYRKVASGEDSPWTSFVEVQKVENGGVRKFSCKIADDLYAIEPQIAPNGKKLLCKVGSSLERYGKYKIAFVDLDNGRVSYGPERISYLRIKWSCDSRYISYVKGGDAEGNQLSLEDPLRLFIYDTQTGKERLVAQNRFVTSFNWTKSDSLLFSQQFHRKGDTGGLAHPSVYEVEASGGVPRLLLSEAFDAQPSPDNRSVAFFHWTPGRRDPEKDDIPSLVTSLTAYNRETKSSKPIRPNLPYFLPGSVKWTPDSKNVVYLQQIEDGPHAKARLSIVSLPDGKVKDVAVVQAKDFERTPRSSIQPEFQLLSTTNNGSSVYIKISEFTGEDAPFLIEQVSLLGVDLHTGQSSLGSKVVTIYGVDWLDLP